MELDPFPLEIQILKALPELSLAPAFESLVELFGSDDTIDIHIDQLKQLLHVNSIAPATTRQGKLGQILRRTRRFIDFMKGRSEYSHYL